MTETNPVGRPLKFKSVQELQDKIDEYFALADAFNKPYTICGLAYYLDTTRETLLDYQDKPEYSDTIKRAKLRCQMFSEECLFGQNVAGPIFNLKANYGYKDKQELDIGGNLIVNIKRFSDGDKSSE